MQQTPYTYHNTYGGWEVRQGDVVIDSFTTGNALTQAKAKAERLNNEQAIKAMQVDSAAEAARLVA